MSQQEDQPRPSLRLRKTSDRPPESPPAEPPPASPAAPAEAPPEAASRPRLSSIIKPGSAGSTPPTPPEPPPPAPIPPPAQAAPPPAFEPAPAPVPKPLPAATPPPAPPPSMAAEPPVVIEPPPVVAAQTEPPAGKTPRAPQFPPPPGLKPQEEREEPKPPSPRAVGLAIGGVIILVLGGLGYLLFLDPLGLFKDTEPPQAAAPAIKAPAAAAPEPTPPPPATAEAAGPGLIEETPEFTMPPPAPLAAGEEIAPGVVRLPPGAAAVSGDESAALPAPNSYEPPAPKPNPAYTALVNNLNISGIRPNSSGGFLMVGTLLYRPGDIVDAQSGLEFVGLDGQVITFKDPAGAIYTRRF